MSWYCDCGFSTGSTELAALHECNGKMIECTCGSGGHPRHCKTHPDRYDRHCKEIDEERS